MQRLVYLGQATGIDRFLDRVAWHDIDGLELDLTDIGEDEYVELARQLADASVGVASVHYARTKAVSLQEWDLFASQLETVVERARSLGADLVSVHPPKAEIGTANTVRDVQEFMAAADAYARQQDIRVCFALDGFLQDPELINTAFEQLDDPSVGIMVDVARIVDGIDQVTILKKLAVDIHKVRAPITVSELEEEMNFTGDVAAVAERLDQ